MKTYKRSAWAMPYFIFLVVFVALPLLMVLIYAFQDQASGKFTFDNFAKFFQRGEDLRTFLYSIEIALINTLICLLLGYPAAWIMANSKLNKSSITIMLFILPMWINMLIRTLATVALFDFAKVPLAQGALIFGMVYNFLPFMIYPIYNQLNKMDKAYSEAATDLGGTTIQENINNGMWNYGSALALIMLVIIGLSVLFSNDDSKRDDEKGGMI